MGAATGVRIVFSTLLYSVGLPSLTPDLFSTTLCCWTGQSSPWTDQFDYHGGPGRLGPGGSSTWLWNQESPPSHFLEDLYDERQPVGHRRSPRHHIDAGGLIIRRVCFLFNILGLRGTLAVSGTLDLPGRSSDLSLFRQLYGGGLHQPKGSNLIFHCSKTGSLDSDLDKSRPLRYHLSAICIPGIDN